MNTQDFKRKLTAVFSADVAGYSRLMGEDEVGTVRTLREYRELMSQLIQEYRGRIVDSPGDNVLAEFASVVDALECSIEIEFLIHRGRLVEVTSSRAKGVEAACGDFWSVPRTSDHQGKTNKTSST